MLVQAQNQPSQSYLNRLGPGERAGAPSIILHQHREAGVWVVDVNAGPWSATAVTSQHILTRSLEVKGPAIERVVVGVSKNCAYTWLFSANRTAASPVEDLIRGAAGDGYTLFGPTLDVAFDASTKSTVDRRPQVPFPVDLVAHAAVLDFLHLDVGKALFTAVVALATARLGAVLLAHHSGILAGAGGAVVMYK